jgi:hypothetical protein
LVWPWQRYLLLLWLLSLRLLSLRAVLEAALPIAMPN